MAYTNSDKILQSVLSNPQLAEFASFQSNGNETIEDILYSSDETNVIVKTVAKIIKGKEDGRDEKELYKEIHNYLFNNI